MRSIDLAQISFLPKLLLARLELEPPIRDFEVSAANGVLLLSDIQQFTSIVERYSHSGQGGLEKLTWLLNSYFKNLVDIVIKHGGDVLYVAGDAFLCHWPMDVPTDTEPVLRAANCALEIQKMLRTRAAEDEDAMATRIGISSGELLISYLGGHKGRWELVISGAALDEVVAAEAESKIGGVLVGPTAWDNVREYCVGIQTNSGGAVLKKVRTQIDSMPVQQIRLNDDLDLEPFIPPAMVDRLDIPESEWLAESRTASVVLANLPPVQASKSSQQHADESIEKFQEIVDRCGGTIKVDVDSKGILLLAAFGLPPKAHENDAERAAYCAQQLSEAIADGAASGIGVATGRAICGAFGSESRRDYMLRGDVINRAARLMQAAERGAVLCDAPTRNAASVRMVFEPRGEITAKGFAESIATYQPSMRRQSTLAKSEIVGRTEEIKEICEGLDDTKTHEIFVIEAEAGLGKSRLLAHAAQLAEARGIRVLRVAADAIEQSSAYHAWRPVFMDIFDLAPGMASEEIAAHVGRAMNNIGEFGRLAPLLSDVLPLNLPDSEATVGMVGDVRAANMQKLLVGLLQKKLATQRLMLAVEDVHWFDSGSWALLHKVMTSVGFEISIITTRPEGGPVLNELWRIYAIHGARQLELESLSKDELSLLLARTLDVNEIPAGLADFIHGRVGGHPFFAEELLSTLMERGMVRVEAGACKLDGLSAENIPTTVEQVIVSRLDALPTGEQMCLKVGSVIGNLFACSLVQQAYPLPNERDKVPERLRNTMRARLVDEEQPEPDLHYMFRHSITRDVAYGTMPGAQRRPLHRAVAKCLEFSEAEHGTQLAVLAHHWLEAADGPKALYYLERAGNQSMRDGAFREAVKFFSSAIELMDAGSIEELPNRRALWEKDIGIASYYLGDMPASRLHLERALEQLHRPVPDSMGRTLVYVARGFLEQYLHSLFPSRFRGRRAAEKKLLDEAVQCYKQLGQAYYMEGEAPPRLLYLTLSGLNLGEEAGASAPLARVMINAAVLYYVIGRGRSAERFAQRAIEMATQPEHVAAQGYVWHLRALMFAQQAEWKQLRGASDKALNIAVEICDNALECEVRLVRSAAARCSGDFAFAPTAWSEAREVAERIGDLRLKARSLLDEVEYRLVSGETDAAEEALAKALAIPSPETDQDMDIEKRRGIAVVRLRQQRLDEALNEADHVFQYILKHPPTGYHMADHLAAVIEVYIEVLRQAPREENIDITTLRRRTKKGVRLLSKYAKTFVNVRPRSRLLRGMYAADQGQLREARNQLALARQSATELGMPFEAGRALLELARLDDPWNESLLTEAREFFEVVDAGYFVRQCVRQ